MSRLLIVLIGLVLVAGLVMSLSCQDDSNDTGEPWAMDTPGPKGPSGPAGMEGPAGPAGPDDEEFEVSSYSIALDEASGPQGTKITISGSGYAPKGYNFAAQIAEGDYAEFPIIDRMIVRTGNMNLKVSDVAETMDRIKSITQSLGGYVVYSDWQGGERENHANISIRVPTAEYDAATVSFRDLAIEVLHESTEATDVTEEYSDLDAQLRNLEATEERYLELLDEAETVEDMLKVEEKLSETRGRIESIQGRMKYLEQTSATSLIRIYLVEESPLEADFEVDKIKVEVGEKVGFTNLTTGGSSPYGYTWDFGDDDIETNRNPDWQTYDKAGEYTVSLTVTDGKGNEAVETKEAYITVVGKSGWSAGDVADGAWDGLMAIGHFLAHVLIWIGVLAVIWVPILVIVIASWWWKKRSSA